ncbi:DUF1015 domain-containing protein [Pollutibacter soli]|uniref:DUF1015 domain-containing protein n=1 Tax=Pollutibacter soli TaxID=3034157 RepID=UPI0030133D2F
MSLIAPFRALRPVPALASQVASRPYDVLNSEEARQEAAGNPNSFLHVTKSEIDLPGDVHVYSKLVYEKAAENLKQLEKDGVLVRDDKPHYYIYRLIMDGRSQTGLVCVSSVDDYNKDLIKKHEFTRPEKEQDRIDHMKTIKAQTGNVFLAYNNVAELDKLINDWKAAKEPVYDFVADDGISHTIWVVDDQETVEKITNLFGTKVPVTYIADGHHRAASASKVFSKDLEGSDFFLTTVFPASELKILDYNRVVRDLNGLTAETFLESLKKDFDVSSSIEPVKPAELHEFGLYLEGKWYRLKARPGTFATDPVGVLDVSILSANVLDKLLGIKDQRTDKRIDFVGGIRGLGELEKRVNSGEMKLAFSFYPVSIEQLFAIADSGNVMPPKSTWFEPKLRDGLLTNLIG